MVGHLLKCMCAKNWQSRMRFDRDIAKAVARILAEGPNERLYSGSFLAHGVV